MPSRDDLSPRGRAFLDAYHRGDPEEMDRLVIEQISDDIRADRDHQIRTAVKIGIVVTLLAISLLLVHSIELL